MKPTGVRQQSVGHRDAAKITPPPTTLTRSKSQGKHLHDNSPSPAAPRTGRRNSVASKSTSQEKKLPKVDSVNALKGQNSLPNAVYPHAMMVHP